MSQHSRRRVLKLGGTVGLVGLAGCAGSRDDGATGPRAVPTDDGEDSPDGEEEGEPPAVEDEANDDEPSGIGPPTADRDLHLDYTIEDLTDAARSGGPPPDGIPAIEEPSFNEAGDPPTHLDADDPVFGVVMNGEAKAYPQYNLVWHEIVNDVIAGEAVSVTYCPLTGTAQGFKRGETTFGVSGQLINTNLVMFDRGTESWWPQMLAFGILGEYEGSFLEEFQVVWTTWDRWRETYPETVVLNEDTGHARDYGRDPYGSYNPLGGYYEDDRILFPPLAEDDRFHAKEVVLGMRNADGALCIRKAALREQEVLEGTLNGTPYVGVYHSDLDTGFVYRNPDERDVTVEDDVVTVDGDSYRADELPLDREIAYDALWLAWYGYYPSTTVLE